MIFCYSGTGNSAYVARELARIIGEDSKPASIPALIKRDSLDIYRSDRIGFVFPIYSWGIPPVVTQFIKRLPADLFENKYVWAVCTCGDEAGRAMCRFNNDIKEICGRTPDLAMSIIMPNNYVLLPGFNVDTPSVKQSKLSNAPQRIEEIGNLIERKATGVYDVHEGSMATLRTALVYPLFKQWGINSRKWHADSKCVGCGKCVEICPNGNITYEEGSPVWGKECLSCCGCFHVCPVQAINYGSRTKGKGQYLFPGYPFKP